MKFEQKIYKNEFDTFYSQFGFSQKETKPLYKQHKTSQIVKKPNKENFYCNKIEDMKNEDKMKIKDLDII